jgi:type IV pilus assembly protein PilW
MHNLDKIKKSLTLPLSGTRQSGFTIIELLVTIFIGLIVLSIGLSTILTKRYVLGKESARTRVTQNLRGALDIVGTDLRIAGENLGSSFPAIQITDGVSGAPDTLIVRRNLIDEVLPLCTAIALGTSVTDIYFADSSATPGCAYSGHTHNFTAWSSYRSTHDNIVDAFIFDTASRNGEFFSYINEFDIGTSYFLRRAAGTWEYSYNVGATAIYVLEEWQYQLNNGVLEVIQNRDLDNPLKVAFGITDFQLSAIMQDGTTKSSLVATDSWTQISQILVELSGNEQYAGRNFSHSVSGMYFPRNVLSN